MECNKQKRQTLTITQKLEVTDLVKKKTSYQLLSEKHEIGKSTISAIVSSSDILKQSIQLSSGNAITASRQSLKKPIYRGLEKSFPVVCQMRETAIPIIGPMLTEEAQQFYTMLYPNSTGKFKASSGFISKFCKRNSLKKYLFRKKKSHATLLLSILFQHLFPAS